ncbi:MAG: hypothetical protein JW712_05795 [Dehalococcoidales bacterium]|nr:hypothetical protein [Dehalococcoidales bacterium]
MYDSLYVERRNKPSITLFYQYFINDAKSAASSRGLPAIRLVPESIISECSVMEEIEAGVDAVFEDIIKALTTPLTELEKNPETPKPENPARIIFKGTVSEVNRFFYQRGWTDGMPIIPPTEQAVAEMLTGTDLPADLIVAKLEPRLGKATVEKIAVAAVMAGALPTYMPVLIAGVKALLNTPMADVWAVSTGAWAPLWVLNGRVRNDLNIHNGFGALSPGSIANSAIGRALGLITKNIRGVRREIEDMGVLGNPMKYCMVTGENEEDSPWEPLHVERGLNPEDSAISLCFPNSYQQLHSYSTDDMGILRTIIYNIAPRAMGTISVMITPPHAKTLGENGWDKEKIKNYIVENAKIDLERTPMYYMPGNEERDPKEQVPLVMARPGQLAPVQIFVAGGWGSWTGLMSGGTPHTEKIELPVNWDKLVAKYKNVVPTYIKY